MENNKAVIGIGSNIRPVFSVALAMEFIKKYFKILAVSSFETTKPIGIANQPDFINGVVLISTDLSQSDLKILLKQIEDDMGRDRTLPKFGPRIIDLDLLIWNSKVVDKDYYTRTFLQKAVSELEGFNI